MIRKNRGYVMIEASIYVPLVIYATFILIITCILLVHMHMTSVSAMQETSNSAFHGYCYDSSAPGFEYPEDQAVISRTTDWWKQLDSEVWGGENSSRSLIGSQRTSSGFGTGKGPVRYVFVTRSLPVQLTSAAKMIFGDLGVLRLHLGDGSSVAVSPVDYSRQIDAAHYYTKNPRGKSMSKVLYSLHKASTRRPGGTQ